MHISYRINLDDKYWLSKKKYYLGQFFNKVVGIGLDACLFHFFLCDSFSALFDVFTNGTTEKYRLLANYSDSLQKDLKYHKKILQSLDYYQNLRSLYVTKYYLDTT